jgi:hypothetical protein
MRGQNRNPMRIATILSAAVFVSVVLLSIWLIPDCVQLHVYCSGYDQCAVGGLSLSNDARSGEECHRRVATGQTNGSHGFLGIHFWGRHDVDNQPAWCINISLWYPLLFSGMLPALWMARRLVRSRLQFSMRTLMILSSAISVVLGSWVLTRHLGIPSVLAHEDARLTGPFKLRQDGQVYEFTSKRVDENPLAENSALSDTTCHYLASATTPFPLIVAFDWAAMMNELSYHNGASGRAYYLWLFGAKIHLSHWDRPGKQVIYE